MLHLVIPMAGEGSRFKDKGFNLPKPLIVIHDKPFFYWSVMSVKNHVGIEDIKFVILSEHRERFGIDREIYKYFPEAEIIVIPTTLPGAVFTCLEGVRDIADDLPVMFNDCDHMFKCNELYTALNSGFDYDGGLLTFESTLPNFSYVSYDNNGRVIGTVEKQLVSTQAICGAYLFRDSKLFSNMARKYVNECPYNECFMSGIYNVMCHENLQIAIFRTDWNVDFGTPEQLVLAEKSAHFTEGAYNAV